MSKKTDKTTGQEFKNTLELIFKYKVNLKPQVDILDLYSRTDIENYLKESGFIGTKRELSDEAELIFNCSQNVPDNLICLVGVRDGVQIQGKTQWVRVHHN